VNDFLYYIEKGIVRKQSPELPIARYLVREAMQTYSILLKLEKEIGLSEDSANLFIKTCYDLLMVLIRARMHADGFKASGQGAHEAEVAYENLG
jgi:hypothetical protein